MRWTSRGRSADIEDRRGSGGFGMRRVAPIGLGGVVILFALSLLTGQNFLSVLDTDGGGPAAIDTPGPTAPGSTSPADERMVDFVSFVLDDAQNTWQQILGSRYRHAKLVLFRDEVQSACGMAESATGPFYCPADERVYIDLGFYDELRQQFGASGDFAQAYVLTHEIGHHVQKLLGTEEAVRQAQDANPSRVNDLSVRLELQADCYAGVWGHSTAQRNILEQGDVEEGLNAAASIGDDRIQRMSGSRVAPERFTHGSSAQRVEWFKRGMDTGDIKACDTFQ
ncbi:MAG TPA: neutral zinc metallopeptidase [Vicinamibacterales bacterium]|jgi:predicted metalloprotease|nr:neutral zinc metallopeptidase [Vicinamibacterales bacterium]